uniref:(California timema) hypothetical protein n=1 Tax=Timema californicum TaxID=61474 RepID=A0A7R9PC60_TIMCA|nr:unnamed protein product [Timema californicum]
MFKNCCGFKSEKDHKNESKETVDTSKEPEKKGNQDKEGSEKLTEMPNGLKIEYDVSGAVPVSEEEKTRVSKKSQKYPDALILNCITIEESNGSVAIEGVNGCVAKRSADGDVGEGNKVTPTQRVADTHEFNSSGTNRGAGDELNLHKIEEELAVRVVPRGILATPHPFKRGSMPALGTLPRWLSQEEDDLPGEGGGTTEPPATPVGRDELALRRHRFFSELLHVAQAGAEHRVHFDPLGPKVAAGADPDCEPRSPMLELNYLLARLEKVTTRLEQTVASQEGNTNTVGKSSLETIQDNNKVNAYRKIIQSSLATFLKYSKIIGGDAFLQAKYVHEAFM